MAAVDDRALTQSRVSMSTPEPQLTPLIRVLDRSRGSSLPEDLPVTAREHMLHSWEGEEVACLVSDMSGFTKLTRKHGIIHFASIIARFRQITLPIMNKYGALLITTEADSFNSVFPDAKSALLAANDMQRHIGEANRRLPEERAHFTLTLDGIGVDFGKGPILDKAGKLHGRTFMNSHMLGEELCTKGSVALSKRAMAAVKDLPEFAGASWKPFVADEGHNQEIHEALEDMEAVFEMSLPSDEEINLPGVDVSGALQEALLQFAKRHDMAVTDDERSALDTEIREKYMQQKTVLMFDFGFEGTTTPEVQVGLKYDLLARFARVFEAYQGEGVEDVLVTFDNPANAVLAALACRRIASKGDPDAKPGDPSINVQGFGVHTGEVLFVPATDIHWGDPVNTSSKLGQDIAEDGHIIISEVTRKLICEDQRLTPYEFVPRECTLSGVIFNACEVWDKAIEPKDKKDMIIKEFEKAKVPLMQMDKETMTRIIMALSPRFTTQELDAMFEGVAGQGSTVDLQAFLERGCSKCPPGSRLKESA